MRTLRPIALLIAAGNFSVTPQFYLIPEPQSAPASGTRSPAAAFAEALRVLTDEAKQSQQKHQMARPTANFAAEFKDSIPSAMLTQKIVKPLNDDPFIDAYIRWQLTSFKPALPELSEREFTQMLADLPALIENPRADRELINALAVTAKTGALSDKQQEVINSKLNDLAERASQTAALNQAALGLRAWLRQQLPKTGERALLAGVEQCAAMVHAGWPVDDVKAKLDDDFKAGARDRNFTTEQRRAVLDQLRQFIGRKNLYITNASLRERTVTAEYADTGIYDFDVRRWARSLMQE